MIKGVNMKIPKSLTRDAGIWLPKTLGPMQEIASMAIHMIRERVTKKGVDGLGKSAPRIDSTGWYFTAPHDKRFGSHVKRIGGRGGVPPILVHMDGYASLKKALGNQPRPNGALTGEMWDSLAPKLKKVRGGWKILLRFFGSQTVGKQPTGKYKKKIKRKRRGGRVVSVKVTRIPKLKTERVSNKVKARMLQKKTGLALLSLSAKEMETIMEKFMELVQSLPAYKK